MTTIDEYGDYTTTWCPGCGNFSILSSLKNAFVALDLSPHEVMISSGIGQAAKTPHYLNCHMVNGLHGRALPVAQGMKMANPDMTVVCESGDGCSYGEGGNHFMAAIRRNIDITLLVHNNQIYGLTKGQASPTTAKGHVTKTQPTGARSTPFNPITTAVALKAGFVARGFSGEPTQLEQLIVEAVQHPGFAIVDILQPCVSFNKVNTFKWYKERCYSLEDHDSSDWSAALAKADEFEGHIPLGVIYRNNTPPFELASPLATQSYAKGELNEILRSYL